MGSSGVIQIGEKPDNGTREKLKARKSNSKLVRQMPERTDEVICTMHSKKYQHYKNKAR